MERQRENAEIYITANMAVISNTSDNRTLTKQNLVSALCFAAVRCTKKVAKIKQKQSGFKWCAKKILDFERFQSCKTCSNFLRLKFKVSKLHQNIALSNSNIYIFF